MEKHVIVGIPCYRCTVTVGKTVQDLIDPLAEKIGPDNIRILLYDDGSNDEDNTWNVLCRLRKEYPSIIETDRGENKGLATVLSSILFPGLIDIASRNQWELPNTFLGRTDPDGEFDEKATFRLVEAISAGAVGALAEVDVTPDLLGGGIHGWLDYLALCTFGELEARIALAGPPIDGKEQYGQVPLKIRVCGKYLYRGNYFQKAVELLPEYQKAYRDANLGQTSNWGIDLALAAIISRLSNSNIKIINLGPVPFSQIRKESKILDQLIESLQHLRAIRLFEQRIAWEDIQI